MKIGFFTDNYLPHIDGVTVSVESCAKALEERGHEVYIIAPKYPRYKDKRERVYRLTSIKLPQSAGSRMALQLPERSLLQVLSIDFDIIHGHPGGSGITFLGLEIARLKNIPHIATYHTLLNRYTHYFFYGKILTPKMVEVITKFIGNLCNEMIAPTQRVKKELLSYGVTKPIHVLPTGINFEEYDNVEKGFLRKKIQAKKDHKILLSISRLGPEKSVDFLLDAFSLIHGLNPKTILVLVGDGSEKASLKKKAEELGIADSVYFLGLINHKYISQIYADADLFVFASQTETQGLVVLEALASHLPVVAVEDEAFLDVVKDGVNGYLVRKNAKEFAEKVIYIIQNKDVYSRFSQDSRKPVLQYSLDKTIVRLEQLYLNLIKKKQKNKKKNFQLNPVQLLNVGTQLRSQVIKYLN